MSTLSLEPRSGKASGFARLRREMYEGTNEDLSIHGNVFVVDRNVLLTG